MSCMQSLTKVINTKFDKKFEWYHINYRVNKLMRETYGKPQEDALRFLQIAEKDIKDNGGYFRLLSDQNTKMQNAIYISQVMISYSKKNSGCCFD